MRICCGPRGRLLGVVAIPVVTKGEICIECLSYRYYFDFSRTAVVYLNCAGHGEVDWVHITDNLCLLTDVTLENLFYSIFFGVLSVGFWLIQLCGTSHYVSSWSPSQYSSGHLNMKGAIASVIVSYIWGSVTSSAKMLAAQKLAGLTESRTVRSGMMCNGCATNPSPGSQSRMKITAHRHQMERRGETKRTHEVDQGFGLETMHYVENTWALRTNIPLSPAIQARPICRARNGGYRLLSFIAIAKLLSQGKRSKTWGVSKSKFEVAMNCVEMKMKIASCEFRLLARSNIGTKTGRGPKRSLLGHGRYGLVT